jgi:hypothetical protein
VTSRLFGLHMHPSWYLLEALEVFTHVAILLVTTTPLVILAVVVTHEWGLQVAPGGARAGADLPLLPPLLWHDVIRPIPWLSGLAGESAAASDGGLATSFSIYPVAAVLLWEAVAFASASLLRFILAYLEPQVSTVTEMVFIVYAVMVQLHLMLLMTLGSVIFAWFLAAAALRPEQYLPYGTAVVVVIGASQTVARSLVNAAQKLRQAIRKAVKKRYVPLTPISRLYCRNARDGTSPCATVAACRSLRAGSAPSCRTRPSRSFRCDWRGNSSSWMRTLSSS